MLNYQRVPHRMKKWDVTLVTNDESLDAFSSVESQDGVRLFGRKNEEIDHQKDHDFLVVKTASSN